ncbi:BPI/LBP/Plunc family like protein [Aduncisulcus paluster]|uniref:BPI/LBP/Plunc family like protein n=1 Tax=Aduncisulcus paluster TaxID=2918883 RepID=A0ABQ5K3A9_9EUKA|nr:BPI/LBP/Plunc family like protein [Aduncisulcus paluster]
MADYDITDQPGVRLFITKDALNFFNVLLKEKIVSIMNGMVIPTISTTVDGIDFSLTNFTFDQFTFTPTNDLIPPYYIDETWTDANIKLTSDFTYSSGSTSDSGTVTIYFQDGSLSMELTVGESTTSPGDFSMVLSTFSLDFGRDDIEVNGDVLDSIVSDIVNILWPVIKNSVSNSIQSSVETLFNDNIDWFLNALPVSHTVDKYVNIEYGLIPTRANHDAEGTYYMTAVLSGSSKEIAYTADELASQHIHNYNSYDINFYFSPEEAGNYSFHSSYTQIVHATLTLNDDTSTKKEYGSDIEKHNVGMCWPESNKFTTEEYSLQPTDYIHVRLQLEAGCGGADSKFVVKEANDDDFHTIPFLQLYSQPVTEDQEPVIVSNATEYSPGFVSIASTMLFTPVYGSLPTISSHNLPITPIQSPLEGEFFDLAIDASVFDSFIKSHVQSGFLSDVVLTDNMIPQSETYVRLTVGSFGTILFPNLDLFYSPSRNIMISLSSTADNVGVRIDCDDEHHGNIVFVGSISISVDVCQSGTYDIPEENIAMLETNFEADVTIILDEFNECPVITGNVSKIELSEPTIVSKKSGLIADTLFLDGFYDVFEYLNTEIIEPFINSMLSNGIKMPNIPGTNIDSINIQYFSGYIYIQWKLVLD